MEKGLFITLEGIEGVGKSTHLQFIADQLTRAGHEVIQTREPGGTSVGEAIREIVLHGKALHITPDTELLLIFSARAQHLDEIIKPALSQGKIVICDRFTDATYAYQGGGRGIAMARIEVLEEWVQDKLRPDLTLLFDAPAELGLARAKGDSEADRFESETITFFEKVRQAYLDLASNQKERIHVIDAAVSLDQVQEAIMQVLTSRNLC